jgi:hypothetical protein
MPQTLVAAPPRFDIGRYSDNELVLFDTTKQESWIIYPPRSAYDFLHLRRPSKAVTVVEHHPWAPLSVTRDHHVQARDACLQHGLECPANVAVQAAVDFGFDPFA